MKRLTLLRHAKSSWKDRTLPDRERPLSERGERDAPKMGTRLLARKARPSLILTSPAVRARSTAKIVAAALGYPEEFLQVEKGLYMAGAAQVLALIKGQQDCFSDLLVVGHNPGLTELANRLLPELRLDNLPTAGAVSIDFATERWSELAAAEASLVFYDFPKNPELLVIED